MGVLTETEARLRTRPRRETHDGTISTRFFIGIAFNALIGSCSAVASVIVRRSVAPAVSA